MTPIFCDVDGVLADFMSAILKAHGRRLEEVPIGEWDCITSLGMTEAEFYYPCTKAEFWQNLRPYPNALNFIAGLKPLGDLVFLSRPTKHPGSWAGKVIWLQQLFRGIPIMLTDGDKSMVSRPGSILIDDNDTNLDLWEAAGGTGILYPRRWNAGHTWMEKVPGLTESGINAVLTHRVKEVLVWNALHLPRTELPEKRPMWRDLLPHAKEVKNGHV